MRSHLRISTTTRLALLASVCVAAPGVALGIGFAQQIRAREFASTGRTAEMIARAGIEPRLERDARGGLAPAGRARRDAVGRVAGEAGLVRLTVVDAAGRVVATSEPARPDVPDAARLTASVAGTPHTVVQERSAPGGEVVEALVPLFPGPAGPAGFAVVEFDAAPTLDAVADATRSMRLLLAAGLGGLYGVMLLMIFGVTRRLRRHEATHRYTTAHDALTGLPNRQQLYDVASDRLGTMRTGDTLALMLLDLDRFKAINDTLGHDQGDEVLREVADRLQQTLRETDTIARLGGDEFAVLLNGVADADAATRAAEKVRAGLELPFTLNGMKIHLSASLGIAVAPIHGRDVTTLMQKADVAMYAAKAARGGVRVYDSSADANTPERLAMIGELRHAMEHDELVLFYQPKALLADGTVEGVEALVRWQHPDRGLVPPGLFIPLAEETGLIKEITTWVVDAALRQARWWREEGTALTISVNISAQNLHDPALTSDIAGLLDRWGADADWIRLEITESAVMEDPQNALRGLSDLADMGLELAMDDYGTGYSALNYLKRLPLSELKIDRSFVSNITADQKDALIIGSTIELGHSLGLRVVAEGVETEADWLGLQMLGCDVAQGFFLGRPMPASDLIRWLEESRRGFVRIPGIAPLDRTRSAGAPSQPYA